LEGGGEFWEYRYPVIYHADGYVFLYRFSRDGLMWNARHCVGRVMGYAWMVLNRKGKFRQAEAPSR
jgi:hypothetical protein